MRVLYVTPYVPSHIRTRPYHLIRALIELGHRVTLLTASENSPEEPDQVDALRATGAHVEVFPVSRGRSLLNCLAALPTRQPLQAAYAYRREMETRLRELANGGGFDVVHVEHLRAARMMRAARPVPVVYDSVDCISLLFEQAARRGQERRARWMTALDLERTRRYEAQLLAHCDQAVVTSARDRAALEELAARYLPAGAARAPVSVITNGVDLDYFRPVPAPLPNGKTIVMTGKMSYHANVTGALYFAHEVLPHVWKQDPGVRFQVVGKDPPAAVRQLAHDERIEVTGTVDDLRPHLARAAVAVCPAPYAVGIQNKLLEAMAMGRPIICTPAAFAGLGVEAEQALRVADTSEVFAEHALRLLADPETAERLGADGRRYVETHHDWLSIGRKLEGIYEQSCSTARVPSTEPAHL